MSLGILQVASGSQLRNGQTTEKMSLNCSRSNDQLKWQFGEKGGLLNV